MATNLDDVDSFAAVCRWSGFRQAAKATGKSPSALSDAVRRLEQSTGVALLNRTTRSVAPTESGARLLSGVDVALEEIRATVSSLHAFREENGGMLRLNVPVSVARLVLPSILECFLTSHPRVSVEVVIDDNAVDIVGAGCDAGIRYEELLSNDMTAVPIGPATQRLVTAASPDYLQARGVPIHPRDLLDHACLRHWFPGGIMPPWEFERNGEAVRIDPDGPLITSTVGAELEVHAALAGIGIVYLFEDWMIDHVRSGGLTIVLDEWCRPFDGPKLYFSKRPVIPRPLRLFLDHVRTQREGQLETGRPDRGRKS